MFSPSSLLKKRLKVETNAVSRECCFVGGDVLDNVRKNWLFVCGANRNKVGCWKVVVKHLQACVLSNR